MLRNRYLIDVCDGAGPRPWDPRELADPVRLDCVFFGRVLQALERRLMRGGRTFVLTWDVERMPGAGPDVVAVVLGDEGARRPRYADAVEAVFKCYGARPWISAAGLRPPTALGALILLEDLRRRARAVSDDVGRMRAARGTGGAGQVYPLPLGYYNQLDLEPVPFARRPTAVVFAGSVDVPQRARRGLGRALRPPRVVARSQMLAALEDFRRAHPDQEVDVGITAGFSSVRRDAAREYSQRLMNARICLAPRGGSVETFRFFEALRYGCVVVGERLPPTWFYTGAPMVTLDDWRTLPELLEEMLCGDPAALARRHAAALAWWQERCSEEAVAAYMAERLNGAGGSRDDVPGTFRRAPPAAGG